MHDDTRWIVQLPDRSRYLRPDGRWDPDPAEALRLPYLEALRLQSHVQREIPHAMLAALAADQPA